MPKKPAAGGEAGPNTIYKATYSPVYEFICRNVAVMRRRSDAYLNATQILKVAGFDKPQRTRVLEREVQKGEHEKVQGGYGKYQGTWVPIERGLALAKQYNVEDLLRPIIDFVPTSVSPPPAPKHAVAPPTKRIKDPKLGKDAFAGKGSPAQSRKVDRRDVTPDSVGLSNGSESPGAMSESATPSPLVGSKRLPTVPESTRSDSMDIDNYGQNGMGEPSRKRTAAMMDDEDDYDQLRRARGNSAVHTPPPGSPRGYGGMEQPLTQDEYNDIILNYFVSESTQIPSVLTNPPYNWDPNGVIDDDNHTALHWAAAMGRTRVIKLLLSAGAQMFNKNNLEQTPLMRSVMFTNNYDLRKFPEVFELLHRSTLNIDKQNRTVFHHIANLALVKGKTHAARYYMEVILSRLSDYPQELADVINFQDEDGETALTLAARARSKRIVKALLDHGADPKIRNRDFKSAEDYILEDERFRSSPDMMMSRTLPATGTVRNPNSLGAGAFSNYHPQLYTSDAAKLAGGQYLSDISSHLQALARSFDAELLAKERDVLQAKAMLTSIHSEISEAGRTLHNLNEQVKPLEAREPELEALTEKLQTRLTAGLARDCERWLQSDTEREKRWRAGDDPAQAGEDYSDLEALTAVAGDGTAAEEEKLRQEIAEKRKKRAALATRLVKAQTEAGTTEKMAQYRRLIAAGCGGDVGPAEIDTVVDTLLESLENETGQTPTPRPAPALPPVSAAPPPPNRPTWKV
ncbi:Transcription factor mbp1 [Vanrija albida]|uniref:Transcription factor mbp1 n=1 Tax=Vanrija albida TaxID=181172 RepID=A0ABR3Q8Y4_9TREE